MSMTIQAAPASHEVIDEHDDLLREFLADTFSIEAGDIQVNDGTLLADFTGNWPREMGGGATASRRTRAHWDAWLVNDILSRYGVMPAEGIYTSLVAVLDAIAARRREATRRPH